MEKYIEHHGIEGMHWGVRLGPPYPLSKEAAAVKSLLKKLNNISYKEFDTLMSPEQVLKTGSGSCHDQVMYEYDELKKAGIDPNIIFFIEADKNGQGGETHSLVSFELNGKVFWLENAWEDNKGLHSYKTEKELVKDVVRKWNKKKQFPFVYDGVLNYNDLKPGMDLQDIINKVKF